MTSEGAGYTTKNQYTGGKCSNADYAYCGGGGNNKFYGIQVENNIKGGFLFYQCPATIIGDRHTESMRDGEYPYIKIRTEEEVPNTEAATITAIRYISAEGIKVNEIDVSEVTTTVYQYNNPDNKHKLPSTCIMGYIDCQILGFGNTGQNGYTIYQKFADGALIWGNCLILQGVPRRRYLVEQNLDMRTIGADTPALPTIFEIGCADCEIWLHPTYCFMGVDRFNVIQTAEHTATIYDYYTGNAIFDGANLGEGEFEIETYLDVGYARAYIDGEGMAWRVRKIN